MHCGNNVRGYRAIYILSYLYTVRIVMNPYLLLKDNESISLIRTKPSERVHGPYIPQALALSLNHRV